MFAISGDSARRALLAGITTMTLSLSACGSNEPPPPDERKTSTADKTASDEEVLELLATDLWKTRKESQNTGNTSRVQFEGLLSPALTEVELTRLQRYKKAKLLRKGAPEITAIETSVSGSTGQILLCLNEDNWTAEEDGDPLDPPSDGFKPWGATAEHTPDGWTVTAEMETEIVKKKKTC
ncbi:MAG: hypothetical protein H7288_04680 [Kineosporiaceae bacterium]|nr:hypothetical protein [Aeromicrobium sp.]